ncbi:MAG: hypothetical protein HY854_11380 [Burkholderiales bacterium]|nr:hypothetical protein [Burkholderiales bacterium]
MQSLLAAVLAWLSLNFSLPAVEQPPAVRFVAPESMMAMRRQLADGERPAATGRADVHAFYDDRSGVVYLPQGWTGDTPAESSMLVHELVHHLQKVRGDRFACPAEREKLAYRAQSRWLEEAGTSLAREFQVDPMTLLVRTNCMH